MKGCTPRFDGWRAALAAVLLGPAVAASAAPPAAETPWPAMNAAAARQQLATQAWQLKHVTSKELEGSLTRTFGQRLEASEDRAGSMATFRTAAADRQVSIVVDRRTNHITISGPQPLAASWLRIVQALDAPQSDETATQIVPLVRVNPTTIRRAVGLWAQAAALERRRKQHIGEFVPLLFQRPQDAAPGEHLVFQQQPFQQQPFQPNGQFPPRPPQPGVPTELSTAPAPPGTAVEALARIGNVQIEIIDDIIIVRGRQEDVDRVLQIIEQIERQSLETRPEVELYPLRHVDSRALAEMYNQIAAIALQRMGPVTVIPLGRPNAVLLIGRRENIPAAVELIQKLDVPAPMNAEFRVFKLKHMSAIDMERTIRQFFIDLPPTPAPGVRTAMGTRVMVIAEFRANALIVQAAPRDMQEVIRLINELDVENAEMKHEVRVFKLRNALADQLAPVLQEAVTGLGPGGQQIIQQQQGQAGLAGQQSSPPIATRPSISLQLLRLDAQGQRIIESGILANMRIVAEAAGNQLIVTGPSASMGLMEALIEQLDGLPPLTAEVKVYTLLNADAQSLATMLQSLFGVPTTGVTGIAQPITPAGETTLVPLRISVDTRTNSIVISGNPADLDVVMTILRRLDEAGIRQRDTRVYRLRNVNALDASNALQGLLQQQLQLAQAAPQLVSAMELIEQQVIVVPETGTNTLIISASPRYFPQIMQIIEDLDRRPPMVVIQVVIAEVRLGDIHQFGVEWGLQDSLMFDRSIATNRFNFEGPGTAVMPNDNTPASLATRENLAGQALANFALGRVDPALGFGGLVLTASNESVQVLLRALEQSQRIEVISRPQVQTLDNQLAFVQVGQNIARITASQVQQFGGLVNSFQDVPVGIILQVQPRTSVDGMITMLVSAEKSELGAEAEGTVVSVDAEGNAVRVAPINITRAQTIVSVRNGQTAILGGLISKSQTEVTRRVPYLADIPVLGRLFRFDQVIQDRSELLIIMTPYIITSDEQNEWLNQRETERMSWCIADIVNIHGPVGISGSPHFNLGTPLIFPDVEPGAPVPATPPPQSAPLPLYPHHGGDYPPAAHAPPTGEPSHRRTAMMGEPPPASFHAAPQTVHSAPSLGHPPAHQTPPTLQPFQPTYVTPPALPPGASPADAHPIGTGAVAPAMYQEPWR